LHLGGGRVPRRLGQRRRGRDAEHAQKVQLALGTSILREALHQRRPKPLKREEAAEDKVEKEEK
jgi:hypothetical protein